MSLSRLELPLPSPPVAPVSSSLSSRSSSSSAGSGSGLPREVAPPEPATPFSRVLRGLGRELDAGERATHGAMTSARSGRDFTSIELIALQSQIYRYSEAVDLATKLVDRATSGLRTVVQGQ